MDTLIFAACSVLSILSITLPAGVAIFAIVLSRRSQQRAWQQDAESLGLEFQKTPNLSLVGRYNGVPIRVLLITRREHSGGRSRTVFYTRIAMRLETYYPPGLRIQREGIGDSLAKLFGGQDIAIGHYRFDRALRVQSEKPDDTRFYLRRPGVIEAFGRLCSLSDELDLIDGVISIRYDGVQHGQALRSVLDIATHQALVIDGRASLKNAV